MNDAGRAVGNSGLTRLIAWQRGVVTHLNPLVLPSAPPNLHDAHINASGQILVSSASAQPGSIVLSPVWISGDLTGDCAVDLADLLLVLSNFGSPQGTYPRGDVDVDGDVDLVDLHATVRLSSTPRLGRPLDQANGAVFLASDEAAFITGQVVSVDGGLLARVPRGR